MLKLIRGIRLFNFLIRKLLRFSEKCAISISNRWRVSGVVKIQVGKTSVNMYSNCDDPIVDCLYYERSYQEISDLSLFIRLAKDLRVVFDVGAFTGLYSLLTAKSNSECTVYSFEPNPLNFRRLVRNRDINRFQHMNCLAMAVGSDSRMIDFYCSSNQDITDTSSANLDFSKSTYSGKLNWESQKVQQVSIDDFIEHNQIDNVDLIKIDTEHYELNVFQGMPQAIKKFRPIVLCEIFLDNERREFFDSFIKSSNYFIYAVIREGIVRLDNGVLPNHDGLNFLFAPGKTNRVYTSFRKMNEMVTELLGKKQDLSS